MNPLEGAMMNPLFMAGLQILNNNRRVPRSQYQGPLAGVGEAMMGAAYQQRLAKQQTLQDEQMNRQRDEWKYIDDQRARESRTTQALQGLLGQQNQDRQQGQQVWDEAMQSEPDFVRSMGAPTYPTNPLDSRAVNSILMGGNSAQQAAALGNMFKPETFTSVAPGAVAYGSQGTVLRGGEDPTKTASKGYKAAASIGLKPGTPEFNEYARKIDENAGGSAVSPFYQFIGGVDGAGKPIVMVGNARTGALTQGMLPGGAPAVRAADSPSLQGAIAGAEKGATVEADAVTNARLDLPKVESQAKYATTLLDKALTHPGLSAVVGVPGITKFLPGTDAAGFKAVLAQIKGKQFLQAFESLKGAGQITEVEGQKATEAEARMDTAQSEEEFKSALTEYKQVIQALVDRVRNKAGMAGAGGANPGGSGTYTYVPGQGLVPQ